MTLSTSSSTPAPPSAMRSARPHVCYFLFCANQYGTERMAISTLEALEPHFDISIASPPGPLSELCAAHEIPHHIFNGYRDQVKIMRGLLRESPAAYLLTTTVKAAYLWEMVRRFTFKRTGHVHAVHGAPGSAEAFSRKWLLNRLPLSIATVSNWNREQLIHGGVRPEKITVIGNFLAADRLSNLPVRSFADPVLWGIVVSRLDPAKRVNLLLDALKLRPALSQIAFSVWGDGDERPGLIKRAAEQGLNVRLDGFHRDIASQLGLSDVYVHTCPEDPAPLTVLEAMAHGVPVILPDAGGAQEFIEHDRSGLIYKACNAASLADALEKFAAMSAADRQRLAGNALDRLMTRFTATVGGRQYHDLLLASAERRPRTAQPKPHSNPQRHAAAGASDASPSSAASNTASAPATNCSSEKSLARLSD